MRPITVLLLSCLLQISAGVHAQNTFECHVRNVPFQQVLDIVRQQTGYTFFFQSEPKLPRESVSMDEKRISIDDFLKKYLEVGAGEYTLDKKSYFIKRKTHAPFNSTLPPPPATTVNAAHSSVPDSQSQTLPDVVVVPVSNGNNHIPKDRATGPFGYIDRT